MAVPNTRLAALAERVHSQLGDTTVEQHHERPSLAEQGGTRRVHWITPGGTVVAPRQSGGRQPDGNTAERKPACKTRDADVELHIFAEDSEATERLHDNMIAAICMSLGRVEMGRYRWVTQEDVELAGLVNRSEYIVQLMTLSMPVVEEIQKMREVVSTLGTAGTIQSDGSVVLQGDIP